MSSALGGKKEGEEREREREKSIISRLERSHEGTNNARQLS